MSLDKRSKGNKQRHTVEHNNRSQRKAQENRTSNQKFNTNVYKFNSNIQTCTRTQKKP